MKAPDISPGTVSKILWHFTGGPVWNEETKRQGESPKPAAQAYNNLKLILRSREIRVGQYKEIVKAILPTRKVRNKKTGKFEIHENVPVSFQSSPVCCISDIPAPHLRYHSYRYGKFAIGFRRESVIERGFNPVLYTLEDTEVVRSIYRGFSSLRLADASELSSAKDSIESELSYLELEDEDSKENISNHLDDIESGIESLEYSIDTAKKSVTELAAFVKTFSREEFGSIYCEREWRSTQSFTFELSDVAMIVLPLSISGKSYYRSFVEKVALRLKLPRRIPVVPWDDLIEH